MSAAKYTISVATLLLSAFLIYSFLLYSSPPFKEVVKNEEASEGKLIWQQYNCNACHQIYGLGGYLGPDLTNEYSLRGQATIRGVLKSGTGSMPDFHLNEKEIDRLIAFLYEVDKTGKSDPRTFTIKPYGTIEQ